MGAALLVFLLVLKAVSISQQDISSEDVNTMLDRLIKQTKQDNDTSISIEMNKDTYIQQEVAESSNDSDIYYLKSFERQPVTKSSGEIFDYDTQTKDIISNKNKTLENSNSYEPILKDNIISGVPENVPTVTENGLKKYENDHSILKSLFEEPDDNVFNLEDDRNGMPLKDTTRKNIPELSTVENYPDQPIRELDFFQEYPETIESRKSNNKEESYQILDQIIKDFKDTIDVDNIMKAATMGQKSTTTAMLLNELNDANQQETDNLAALNYVPDPLKAVLNNYDPRNDIFHALLEDILHNKPKNDFIVNQVLSTFDDSTSRSSNMLLENILQQRANTAGPAYVIPYHRTSMIPIIPSYQPNFRRSIVNHPVSYLNQPLAYHSWSSPLKFSPAEKFKHTYFTSAPIDKLTTRPILRPLNYNAFYK